MTPLLSFFVPGIPVAKGRPRFVRATGRTYTPEATANGERNIAQFAAEAMRGRQLIAYPIELRIIATYLAPKSRTRAQKALPWSSYKGSRPDCDNLIKAAMDSGNGVIWTDDALIASAQVAKVYGDHPGLRISIYPLTPTSWPFNELQQIPEAA